MCDASTGRRVGDRVKCPRRQMPIGRAQLDCGGSGQTGVCVWYSGRVRVCASCPRVGWADYVNSEDETLRHASQSRGAVPLPCLPGTPTLFVSLARSPAAI